MNYDAYLPYEFPVLKADHIACLKVAIFVTKDLQGRMVGENVDLKIVKISLKARMSLSL